ncbi:MAG: hypothetical protein HXS41_01635 [Theionarchaea archaeon]|nr:hypothetical protein [Theionarchaea archaeon]MBU7018177.1 hypothetical protein [Theionarchaea archaeon]MBU7019730.1 hypothetical protein [Theionarchaea archaeon]
MRDKVLCRGWAGKGPAVNREKVCVFGCTGSADLIHLVLPTLESVPLSVQGGVKMKMSIDEFLDFLDLATACIDQKIHPGFLDINSRQDLDTICTADSLFRGTVVDFYGLSSRSGGGNNARDYSAVS